MNIIGYMGRGGLAGACAGLVSGLFSLLFAEATLEAAIALEHEHGAELFTRDVQQVGLLVAAVLAGVAIGIIFGAVYALVHRSGATDPWRGALRLAVAGFTGVSLLPFLRYPANPPGVGDPATVDQRTALWLSAIAIGLATMAAAGYVRSRVPGGPRRDLATLGTVLSGLVVVLLLPAPGPAGDVPADLLWTFRAFSLATTAVLWAGLGVGFGLAGLRRSAMAHAAAAR